MATQALGNANLNVGFEETLFVSTETTLGTASAVAAGDAVKHLSLKLGYKIDEKWIEEKAAHRGVEATIEGRGSGEWSLDAHLRPGTAAGAPPDLDALLACIFPTGHEIGASAIQASPTPTALQFDVDSAADMADDDLLLIPLAAGGRVVRLEVTSNTLAVSPGLPTAPAGTETPGAGYTYRLTTKPVGSVTIARKGSFFAEWAGGCWVNKLTLKFSGSEEPRVTLEGGYTDKAYAHDDTLAAAIVTTDGVAMTVTNPYKFRASTTCPAYVQIDDEVIKITSVNTTTGVCVIARAQYSTSAATHLDEAAITAYCPTPSYTTVAPLSGLAGKIRFADTALAGLDLSVASVEISIDNKCKAINGPYGTSIPQGYITGEKREVSAKIDLYYSSTQAEQYGKAFARSEFLDVVAQCGDVAAACMAACIPKLHCANPSNEASGAEEIMVSLEGRALADSTGNDELILAFF